jgi:ligand-binding sensor domain-containing protein/signal transduction histidine kinase
MSPKCARSRVGRAVRATFVRRRVRSTCDQSPTPSWNTKIANGACEIGYDHYLSSFSCRPSRQRWSVLRAGGPHGVVISRHVLALSVLLVTARLDVQAERLPITIFTTADGLAHNTVNRIVKDSRGFLWFCTADGLSRFDGYVFTNFGTEQGLPHSSVNDLLETRAGEYWVATDGGLVHFAPKGTPDRQVAYENANSSSSPMFTVVLPDDENRLARAITVLLEGRDGTIWVGTNTGVYRLEQANGRRSLRPVDVGIPNDFPEQRIVADVLEDERGSLWMAAPSGLYRRWPDGTAARYTTLDDLPNDYVQDLLEDHEGQLWAGTRLGGFFRFTANETRRPPVVNLKFTDSSQYPSGLPTSWVSQLFETSDHRFWVATPRGLVEFFRTANRQDRFRTYAEGTGLSDIHISTLTEDLGGNLWLGTGSSGAMKLTRGGFSTYGEQDGIEVINAAFEDQAGSLCFRGNVLPDARTRALEGAKSTPLSAQYANFQSLFGCFEGRQFDWFKPAAVTDFGWVAEHVDLRARNGEWWVGTGEGLYRFPAVDRFAQLETARPLAVYRTHDGLAAPQVFRLFEDSHGNVWISTISSTANGLARWEPLSGKIRDLTQAPGLPSFKADRPRSFGEDPSGNVWIGFNEGLARYAHGSFQLFTANDGLPPGAIKDIHADHSGRLWLASARGGLVRVDHLGAERPAFVGYTTTQGLSSNNTEVITEDINGHLYVGGGHGLDRLDPATGRVKHFTIADGLPPGIFKAAFRDRNGVLWFGMSRGLARLAPIPEKPPVAPPVLITGLRVTGVPQLVSALGEQDTSLPDLAPHQNHLQIDFVGLRFGPGEVVRYQYKLEGTDIDWSTLSEQRTVTYANLAAGRYTFLVRAVNSDGIISDRPAFFSFRILRPFWLRWWFVTAVVLAMGLAIHAAVRYRVARLLAIANMRTRIAADLHDDIGANLTRIALLSEVAKQKLEDERRASSLSPVAVLAAGDEEGPLGSIARIARESVASMSDIVWAINPARDSLLDLTRRMRQHADEIFSLRGIELRFTAPGAHDGLKLGVDVRRDLLLIFKEAVNNSARHSRSSRVEIELRVEPSRLLLTIVDNGVGFDTSLDRGGQGLMSMRRRADRLKGALEITSGGGFGTTVMLTLPM